MIENRLKKISYLTFLLLAALSLASGCQLLKTGKNLIFPEPQASISEGTSESASESAPESAPEGETSRLDDLKERFGKKGLYIQSITGERMELVRDLFHDIISKQNQFYLVELLPDKLDGLSVLRLEVLDFLFWENEELVPILEDNVLSTEKIHNILTRRNAIVRMRVSAFEADTGKPLVRRELSEPFQQIYLASESGVERVDEQLELQRLASMVIINALNLIRYEQYRAEPVVYEEGTGNDWISRNIYNLGDSRIKKGIRYAKAGDYAKAAWLWKIVLYGPAEAESEEVYLINRTGAFYNLGLIYRLQEKWLLAADMFSRANRLNQKLKYANNWAESMQAWREQRKSDDEPTLLTQESQVLMDSKIVMGSKDDMKSELLRNLEINDSLLLNAKDLWPLDPAIKQLK